MCLTHIRETLLTCLSFNIKTRHRGTSIAMFAMTICYNGNQKGEAYQTSFSWLSGHIKVVVSLTYTPTPPPISLFISIYVIPNFVDYSVRCTQDC